MKNINVMQCSKSLQTLVGHLPNGAFINDFLDTFVLGNHLKNITSFKILSDDAEGVCQLVIEGVFVAEDVGVV